MIALARPSVHAVSSRSRLLPTARTTTAEVLALTGWIEACVAAGVDVLQIREPGLDVRRLRDVVRDAVRLSSGSRTRVIVNGRADVALSAGARGVHSPASGLPPAVLRGLAPDWLVGQSIHEGDETDGSAADYLIFGTVFPSRSKPADGPKPTGLAGLRRAVRRFERPVLAIGGIDLGRVSACFEQGAAGIAAIGLFLPAGVEPEALGPVEAVRAIRTAFLEVRPGTGVDLLE